MFKKSVALMLLMSNSIYSFASDNTAGKITAIGGQVNGTQSIYFGLDAEPQNRPACSTNSTYYYVFDPATDEGKALYSMILYAKAQDKSMSVRGSGSCILGQPLESIVYWSLME